MNASTRNVPRVTVGTTDVDGDRGVDILDGYGGLISIADADIPQLLVYLTSHLAGDTVSILAQSEVQLLSDSIELDDALALVRAQIAPLRAREDAVLARIVAIEAAMAALPVAEIVETVPMSLEDLFRYLQTNK